MKLVNIFLSSNYFTRELPASFANLINLKDLVIQASGLTGPIPSGIALLENVSDLRISDLNRSAAAFPPLNNVKGLKTLWVECFIDDDFRKILRSCNIIGQLPEYLKNMTTLNLLLGLDLYTGKFTLRQIRAATNDFDAANKIGEGGFGPVYKGFLSDGTVIAVKQLSSKSRQGNRPEEHQLKLDWPTRQLICVGIARGLAYLHEESRLKIVRRDIKATNVLLDRNLNPKISDFGLAKLDEGDSTHISTRVAGTHSFLIKMPLYFCKVRGKKFDILVLSSNLQALFLKEKGSLLDLVDPRLGSSYKKDEAMVMIKVALLCTNVSPAARPTMSLVVSMLEGSAIVPELVPDSSVSTDEMTVKAMREHFRQNKE
ncbi:hypothetical protein CJ030_MR1G001437 [Morella rubra]|uniref:non-specific serine/threonine protein kinase n=1 Tax=Morella rubra TaxID=262757 RepID=A0A6A1WMS6_9ROSI|nr:hypothetical protein CJ030_MR1G001437 [Morella rubra]